MHAGSPANPVNPLHLVLGGAAAGCVQAACDSWGMPGAVLGFVGDLALGPLDDAESCAASPRAAHASTGNTEDTLSGSHAPSTQWRSVLRRLEREGTDAVVVWGGDNVGDAIFLAMACDRLAGRPEGLWIARVPMIDGRSYVAMYPPKEIVRLFGMRCRLGDADRLALALEFARIRDTCGPVRRLEQGRVVGVPVDYYDPLLLAACGPDWRPAGWVVGTAMGHCDGPNLMSDGFFGARLRALVEAGRVEASGPCTALRDCSVRLAQRPR